jgi:hypothetical protein
VQTPWAVQIRRQTTSCLESLSTRSTRCRHGLWRCGVQRFAALVRELPCVDVCSDDARTGRPRGCVRHVLRRVGKVRVCCVWMVTLIVALTANPCDFLARAQLGHAVQLVVVGAGVAARRSGLRAGGVRHGCHGLQRQHRKGRVAVCACCGWCGARHTVQRRHQLVRVHRVWCRRVRLCGASPARCRSRLQYHHRVRCRWMGHTSWLAGTTLRCMRCLPRPAQRRACWLRAPPFRLALRSPIGRDGSDVLTEDQPVSQASMGCFLKAC